MRLGLKTAKVYSDFPALSLLRTRSHDFLWDCSEIFENSFLDRIRGWIMNKLHVFVLASLFVPLIFVGSAIAQNKKCKITGIKSTKDYLRRGQTRCFRTPLQAENRGYAPFEIPTPEPSPTPTPVPPTDFDGTWKGDLTAGADNCATEIPDTITPIGAMTLQRFVTHTDDLATGEDVVGRVAGGPATETKFTLKDYNNFDECPSGRSNLTEVFIIDDEEENTLNVTRTEIVTCPALGSCTRVWTGPVTKQ